MEQTLRDDALDDEAEQWFGFEDLLRILRRHWRMILAVTATITAIVAQVLLMIPNSYVASATVQVEQRRKQIVQLDPVLQELNADTPTVESEVEVLRSANLALKVIKTLNLRSDPEFGGRTAYANRDADRIVPAKPRPAHSESVSDFVRRQSGADTDPTRDEVLQSFLEALKVGRIRNSLLIEVAFTSTNPKKAAKIANEIVDTYLAEQIKAKTEANTLAGQLLNERIQDMRKNLAASERNLENFKSSNDLFDANGHSVLEKQLTREAEALIRAKNKTAEAQARYNQARRMILAGGGGDSFGDVLKSVTVRTFRDELAKAMRRDAELRTKYGRRHPALQKSSANVSKARAALTQEINSIIQNLKVEFEIAQTRERQLTDNLATLKRKIAETNGNSWQLEELARDVKTSRKLYDELVTRRKAMIETANLQFPDSKIVQRATVPIKPSGPKRKQLMILACLAGLIFSFAAAFMFEVLRPGFDRSVDTERELALEQIGLVPDVLITDSMSDRLRLARMVSAEPRSPYSEAIRGMAYAVESRTKAPQILLVASALPEEGRSTIASNLALQFSLSGHKTILVDGDIARAGLSQTLGLGGQPGLADILAGRTKPSDALLHDLRSGLHVLPANGDLSNPAPSSELLGSADAKSLLVTLRQHFDYVIVDTPALLPTVDGRILAAMSDHVLMTFRWRVTAKTHVKQAIQELGPHQTKVIGTVMNRMDLSEYSAAIGLQIPARAPKAAA